MVYKNETKFYNQMTFPALNFLIVKEYWMFSGDTISADKPRPGGDFSNLS